MKKWIGYSMAMLAVFLIGGCSSEKESAKETGEETAAASQKEPDYIVVQHILIGYQGSVPGKPITRSQEEAKKLAEEIFERAKGGEDFDALVVEFTDDSPPGIYKMANVGIEADMSQRVFPRERMVPAFGDVGFPLAVGEIGMAEFDPAKSPYGWHIIKRVE